MEQLFALTDALVVESRKLDDLERLYAQKIAEIYFSESVQARSNAEARQHEVTKRMELDHKKFLTKLYDQRGSVRELRLKRDAIMTAARFMKGTYEK